MADFAVIGLGRFGSSVAKTLFEMGHNVLAIDKNPAIVQSMANHVTHAVQVNSIDPESLKAVGITNFDVVIVAIGVDIQESILTAIILKELGVKEIIAKATTELQGRVLEKIGATRVVFPERDMGIRLAHTLSYPNVVDYMELSPDYSVEEIVAADWMVGKSLSDLDIRNKYNVTVLLLKKRGGQLKVVPAAGDKIEDGDVLITAGLNKDLHRLLADVRGG